MKHSPLEFTAVCPGPINSNQCSTSKFSCAAMTNIEVTFSLVFGYCCLFLKCSMFIVGTFNLACLLSSIHCYLPWAALYHPLQHIFNHHCRHHHCHHNQNYHRLCITELDAFILTCLGRVINPSFHLNSGEIITILYGVVYQTSKKRHMSHPNTRKD